mgnify:CR=1 FL=1
MTSDISSQQTADPFDPGTKIFDWTAFDYHPHQRGFIWILVFCFVICGLAAWAIFDDFQTKTTDWGWLPAFSLFLAAVVYFWAHRHGNEPQQVTVCENGFFVGERFVPREKISGFWFVYDKTVSVLNLQLQSKRDEKIMLQMGELAPDFFREKLSAQGYSELTEKKESLTDLWIRALKL